MLWWVDNIRGGLLPFWVENNRGVLEAEDAGLGIIVGRRINMEDAVGVET